MQYTFATYIWLDEQFLLEWFDDETDIHTVKVYLEVPKYLDYPSYSNEDDYVRRQYVENGLPLG
jgi:hypothetical protein